MKGMKRIAVTCAALMVMCAAALPAAGVCQGSCLGHCHEGAR